MARKLTHEQFMEKLYIKNDKVGNIEVLEKYINSRTPIKCKCKIDGHEWSPTPKSLLKGHGCPECYQNSKTKTHEKFIEELTEINSNIEILDKYTGNKIPIKCRCKIDGYEWSPTPSSLLQKKGCPQCGGSLKLTHEEFIERVNNINSNIKILSQYINSQTKVECECKICNHKWDVSPSHLLHSQSGCPMCFENRRGDIRQKTYEQFIKELSEINPNIEVLEKYINNRTPIKCRCKIDKYEWSQRPNHLLRCVGCPKCNSSKGEKRIAKYLKECNIENIEQYRFNDCKFKQTLPFDFYIPSLNIAIEFDGKDHYEIFIRSNNETYEEAMDRFIDRKIRDTIKTIYCEENNIRLIRIPYWEFDNIENILDKIL